MGSKARKIQEEDILALTRLLSTMVESIVDDGDLVTIQCGNGATEVHLSVEVAPGDVRFLNGHRGATRDALTRIMVSAAKARGVMVRLNFQQL